MLLANSFAKLINNLAETIKIIQYVPLPHATCKKSTDELCLLSGHQKIYNAY